MATLKQITDLVAQNAHIAIEPRPEYSHPRDSFEFQDDIDHVIKEAQWNEWAWCCVKVSATYKGITESEYLGACSYKDEADFRACDYFKDMARCCIECLAVKLKDIQDTLEIHA
jgi:hypothetical protein